MKKKKVSQMERQRRQAQSQRDTSTARHPIPPMPPPDLDRIRSEVDEAEFALLPPEEQEIVTKLYAYRFGLLPNFDVQRVASDAMYVSSEFFAEHGISDMDEKRLVYALATSGMFEDYGFDPEEFDDPTEPDFCCPPMHLLSLYQEAGGSGWIERVIELSEGLGEKILEFEFLCLYVKVDDSFAPYEFRFAYSQPAALGNPAL